ncbi:MAG: SLC13 family permease [Myxococcota bacterium]
MRRRRRRVILGVALVLVVIAIGPTDLLQRWTGLEPGPAVTLALVMLAAVLWVTEAVPLFVTSFVILILELGWLRPVLLDHGVDVPSSRFLAPFFSNVVLLFLGGFVLSAAFRRFRLDERLARRVLDRSGGEPAKVLAAMIAVTALLSMWMSNTATAAMMLGLAMPLLSQVPDDDPFRRALPLGIAFGANFGGIGTPIGTPPNAIAVEAMIGEGNAPDFASWLVMALPMLVVFLALTWGLLVRMYPAGVERVSMAEGEPIEDSSGTRLVLSVAVLTILLWLTSGVHPLETGTVALIPVVVFFGARILTNEDFRRLPWDVLILAGGGLSLGAAVEASGLSHVVVSLIPEGMGPLWLATALALIAGLMTTFMSNTATANLLVPVVVGISEMPTAPLLMVVAYACSCTMILPVSTPPNAIAFSSGYLTTRDLVRPALILSALALAVSCTVGPLWWSLFLEVR